MELLHNIAIFALGALAGALTVYQFMKQPMGRRELRFVLKAGGCLLLFYAVVIVGLELMPDDRKSFLVPLSVSLILASTVILGPILTKRQAQIRLDEAEDRKK